MAGHIRISEDGVIRSSESNKQRATEDYVAVEEAAFNAIHEDDNNRITENGNNRVYEQAIGGSEVSDLSAKITVIRSDYKDLNSKATVIQSGYVDLGGTVTLFTPSEDIGATTTVLVSGASDLGAQITLFSPSEDFAAKLTIPSSGNDDLGGTIKIVTYSYTNFYATIFIKGTSDLAGSAFIIPHEEFNGKITIPTVEDFEGKVNVCYPDASGIGGSLTVMREESHDLGGYIGVGTITDDLPAIVTIDTSLQELKAKVDTSASGYLGLGGSLDVGVSGQLFGGTVTVMPSEQEDLGGSVDVGVSGQLFGAVVTVMPYESEDLGGLIDVGVSGQLFGAKLNVERYDTSDLGGIITNESTPWQLPAIVTVEQDGSDDLGSEIDITANVPTAPYPTGYIIPSGFPPLPSGWVDPSGIAVPPSGAVAIQEGSWQQEQEVLFVWTPPSGWGYGASASSYSVAWNDEEEYTVTDSDQYVPDNYINKAWYDSGSMWFHVRPKNSYGYYGEQSSYNIKINYLPTAPSGLYVDYPLNDSGLTNTSSPTLYWSNASDADQLDTLSYQMQIYPSGVAPGGIDTVTISGIAQSGAGDTSDYTVSHIDQGDYIWRVRTFDSKQYGDWSEEEGMAVVPLTGDLGAKATLVAPWLTNFKAKVRIYSRSDIGATTLVVPREPLLASVSIPRTEDLGATVRVITALNAKVTIVQDESSDLGAQVTTSYASNLSASVNVLPASNFKATVNITSEYQQLAGSATVNLYNTEDLGATVITTSEHQRFGASINIMRGGYSDLSASFNIIGLLKASVTVMQSSSIDFSSIVTVLQDATGDVGAKIDITPYNDFKGSLTVLVEGYSQLGAITNIEEDHPADVVVTSVIADGVWQEENDPTFNWTAPADPFYSIDEYYVQWNEESSYEISDDDQRVNALTIDKYAFDAGKWYFHIKARNTIGNWSENTTHYEIWYNHAPSGVVLPLLTDGAASSYGNLQPEFSWGNAGDIDQLDTLSYNVQMAPSAEFNPSGLLLDIHAPQGASSERTTYDLAAEHKLISVGTYYWRVRTFDDREYSDWESTTFTLEAATESLGATLNIPILSVDNLGAQVNVIGYSLLDATVNIAVLGLEDFNATVKVVRKTDTELGAKLTIFGYSELGATVIIPGREDLGATANILGEYAGSNLGGKVYLPEDVELYATINILEHGSVGTKTDVELGASIVICEYTSDDLGCRIYIPMTPVYNDLGTKVTVYTEESFGFIDEFSRDFGATANIIAYGTDEFGGSVNTIADRPGEVIITANVLEATWQEEYEINFEWIPTFANFLEIESYYTELNTSPVTEVDESFQNTGSFHREFNLELLHGADIYYFHVAAKTTNGLFGPTSHFAVWYNHRVPNPIAPMLVNNLDSIIQFVMVSVESHILLEWGQSIDLDPLDSIVYRLQIAVQEDFGVNELEESSIIYEQTDITTFYHLINGGVLDSGTYYWRVTANDGHQDSTGWSPTGRFYMNTPPSVPIDLIVYN